MKTLKWLLAIGFVVGAVGCGDDQSVETFEKKKRLSDVDGDGLYASLECGDASSPNGGCVVMPGPDECAFIEYTETRKVVTDAEGNVVEESVTYCTQCLDPGGNPIGEPDCTTDNVEPIACQPVPSPDPTVECWECSTPDGELLYQECYEKPTACASDAECPEGQVCRFDYYGGGTPPSGGANDAPGFVAPAGYCGYPDPAACTSDADCPEGQVCYVYDYAYGTDESQMDAIAAPSGYCSEPYPVDPCSAHADEATCGTDPSCVWYDYGMPCAEGEECKPGVCQTAPPPGEECWYLADQASCGANANCVWYEETYPCDDPNGNCGWGYCAPSYTPPPDACAGHYDAQSCEADTANGCAWATYWTTDGQTAPDEGYCYSTNGGGVIVVDPAPGQQ